MITKLIIHLLLYTHAHNLSRVHVPLSSCGCMSLMHEMISTSREAPNKSSECGAQGEVSDTRKKQKERFSSKVFGYLLCFKGTCKQIIHTQTICFFFFGF